MIIFDSLRGAPPPEGEPRGGVGERKRPSRDGKAVSLISGGVFRRFFSGQIPLFSLVNPRKRVPWKDSAPRVPWMSRPYSVPST